MKLNMEELLKGIARVHNTTPEEVYKEMQTAVDAAFSNPKARSEWGKVKFKGEKPTPEDLIRYCVEQLTLDNEVLCNRS